MPWLRPPEQVPSDEPDFPAAGGEFRAPVRIFRTATDWLLVSDTERRAVLRVDPVTLSPDQALPIFGTPLAVGMHQGELFVGVREKKALEIRTRTGAFKGFLAPPGAIGLPSDLAVDAGRGLLFALDGMRREVQVYRIADRARIGTIGSGALLSPAALGLDEERSELLVSDYGASGTAATVRIYAYQPDGTAASVATLSGAGKCTFMGCSGGFSRPQGLVARHGRIYVPDAIYGQVLVYDRGTLERLATLGSSDPAARDLRLPADAIVIGLSDLLVASTGTHAVVAFRGAAP